MMHRYTVQLNDRKVSGSHLMEGQNKYTPSIKTQEKKHSLVFVWSHFIINIPCCTFKCVLTDQLRRTNASLSK